MEAEIERLSRLEAQRAFDLSHDVLLRTKVLRVSADEHVVLVTMHHIISDGWSIGVLVKEVAALYEAYAQGSAVTLEAAGGAVRGLRALGTRVAAGRGAGRAVGVLETATGGSAGAGTAG